MGKPAEFKPAWLVGLLNQWARRELASIDRTLGFASGSSWMRGLKSSPASSIDPTGYAARDFRELEKGLERLCDEGRVQWAALMMYYKPWVVRAFQEEGYPFGRESKTYYNRLHEGHRMLAGYMDEYRQIVEAAKL